jgi:hypothetical protein
MIRKPIAILTYIATLALMGTISSGRAIGQQGEPHYSLKELHRLVATARDGADYGRLAEYFHHEKQVYRAKADAEMVDYAKYCSFYHPKFPTGADYAARMYKAYSDKADHAEELAAFYDDLLVRNGLKPANEWLTVSTANMDVAGAINELPKQPVHSAFHNAQTGTGSAGQAEKP